MSIDRKIYWILGSVSIALLLGSFLTPGDRPAPEDLPWHIEHPTIDSTRVLGLTLGKSTPDDAEQRFREKGEFGLFVSADGQLSAEVFFEQINLAGLRSKVVLTLVATEVELKAIRDRGLRVNATMSGRKISLAPDDADRMRGFPIGSLTLIPGVRIKEELFEKRFGKPGLVIREAHADVTHRLYPQHALDIISSGSKSEKQVLQFVPPKDYDKLAGPLLKAGGKVMEP